MNKQKIIDEILIHLEHELSLAVFAANEAHCAAVDDQSKAETQYDTLAIEAAYLAEGQSKRVTEYQQAIKAFQALSLIKYDHNKAINLTALVQLSKDVNCNSWFFIGPFAGGFRCTLADRQITVITPQSPMGQAVYGKYQDDDIEISLGNEILADYIHSVE